MDVWRQPRTVWLLLFALALTVRLGAALAVQSYVDRTPGRLCLIAGDAEGYWELGGRILHGRDFAIYDPPRYILRMPGFPAVLAACRGVFQDGVLPTRLVLAFLGACACLCVGWLGTELFDVTVGQLATLLAALIPTFVAFSVLLLSETLFALALLISLALLARLVRRRTQLSLPRACLLAALAGLACGLATLVRPTWLLIAPGFCLLDLWLATDRRKALLTHACLLLALAVTMAPWTIRNERVCGHYVPTTLWVGASLYDGLRPGATGDSDMQFIETDGVYQRLSEYDADRFYKQAALEYAKTHPWRAFELGVIKLGRFWSPVPNADQFRNVWLSLATFAVFVLMMGLAVLGLWKNRRQFWNWFLPLGPVLYLSALHTLFVGSVRYRLPAEYPLLVLTAAGAIACRAWIKSRAGQPAPIPQTPRAPVNPQSTSTPPPHSIETPPPGSTGRGRRVRPRNHLQQTRRPTTTPLMTVSNPSSTTPPASQLVPCSV